MNSTRMHLIFMSLAAGLVAADATAGLRSAFPVVINDNQRMANGAFGNGGTPGDSDSIFCVIGAESQGSCGALVLGPVPLFRSCVTSNTQHLALIRGLNEDSVVTFMWDAAGNCTNIIANIGSRALPARAPANPSQSQVSIDETLRRASGLVGGTYNSSDAEQWIQCAVYIDSGTTTSHARCTARDATARRVDCDTSNPALLANIGAMSSTSELYFEWTNPRPLVGSNGTVFGVLGDCSRIRVTTGSQGEAKIP